MSKRIAGAGKPQKLNTFNNRGSYLRWLNPTFFRHRHTKIEPKGRLDIDSNHGMIVQQLNLVSKDTHSCLIDWIAIAPLPTQQSFYPYSKESEET